MTGAVFFVCLFIVILFKVISQAADWNRKSRPRAIVRKRRKKRAQDWDPIPDNWKPQVPAQQHLDVPEEDLDKILEELTARRNARRRSVEDATVVLREELKQTESVAVATPPPPTEPAGDNSEIQKLCERLFPDGYSTLESNRVFEETLRDTKIEWSGTLVALDRYSYDFVFGNQPGLKAKIRIHQLNDFGHAEVFTVVGFPVEAESTLRPQLGQTIRFAGTLRKLDGLMRSLYVVDGRVVTKTG